MTTLFSLLLLVVFLSAGFAVAKLRVLRFGRVAERVFSLALYLLLFSMGLRLGQSRDVLANLPLVGALAVTSTVCCCAATVILHFLLTPAYRRLGRAPTARRQTPSFSVSRRVALLLLDLRKPGLLLALVVAGSLVGFALPVISALRDGTIATWFLYFLLFIIGMQMASSETSVATLIRDPLFLLVPAVSIVGTLVGSLGALAFDGMTPGKALALGAGFGWYSLSGVLISNLGDPLLGTASFLANLFRETLSFLFVPVLSISGRCESGVGLAGATSMDVTLPVIEDTWGPTVVPLSVMHGVALSFLVPFLVPLFMSF